VDLESWLHGRGPSSDQDGAFGPKVSRVFSGPEIFPGVGFSSCVGEKRSFCGFKRKSELSFSAAILAQLDCDISQCDFVPVGIEDNVMVVINIAKKELSEEQNEMTDGEDWEVECYERIKENITRTLIHIIPKFIQRI